MAEAGWRELKGPRRGADAFAVSAFSRLARAHAMAVAGDTLVTIALAGTLFFSIDPSEARWRVFLYLALTMAPFAVVAPLVGPALDRSSGGRRWMVVGTSILRAVVCGFMIRDVDSLLLFPEAFALLVLSKSYHVAKSALVPSTVHSDEELVEANSKLSLISGIVGFIAAIPGGLLLQLGDSEAVFAFAVVIFGIGAIVSLNLPKATVAIAEATEDEREELRSGGIRLAATAMGLFRGIVGFLTFLLAFRLRTDGSPAWHFGVVLALSAGGALAGAGIAPHLRRRLREERIIIGLLGVVTAIGLLGAWGGGLAGAAVMAGTVGVGAAAAKQAFDAIVQRDAPDANRGRSFARFETRFQLIWVVGAALGIVPMPMWTGFLVIAVTAAFAAVSYEAGSRGQMIRLRPPRRARRRDRTELGFAPDPAVPPTVVAPRDDDRAWRGDGGDDPVPDVTEVVDVDEGRDPAASGGSAYDPTQVTPSEPPPQAPPPPPPPAGPFGAPPFVAPPSGRAPADVHDHDVEAPAVDGSDERRDRSDSGDPAVDPAGIVPGPQPGDLWNAPRWADGPMADDLEATGGSDAENRPVDGGD